MKKIFTITSFLIMSGNIFSQYPCLNGISTDPHAPINLQLPSKKNTFFDWQATTYLVQPMNTGCIRGSLMESPFYKIDNLEELRESKDMKWEDGWELIRRGFGLTEQNTYTIDPAQHLYLILYNKYTGILRVLLKTCRGVDYNAAKITIKFNPLSQIKTDLIEFSRGSVSALDKKFNTTIYAAGAKYINDDTKWFYADFPMMYDPCACLYSSKINIISELISTSNIMIEGGITGDIYTKDVGGKAQVQKPGSTGWQNVSGFVNGKLATSYGSVNNFVAQSQKFAENIGKIDTTNKKSALDNLGNFLKSNQFLKAGLNAIPWIQSAMSLFDIFIGGGKTSSGPQEVKVLPLTVNLTAKLSGTLQTTMQYHDIQFTNPGSKNAQLDPDAYPYYNETLGVFNLIKTPVAFYELAGEGRCDARRCYGPYKKYKFRFDSDSLLYVLNPASQMTIQNMKAAIIVKGYIDSLRYNEAPADMTGRGLNAYFPYFEGQDAMDGSHKFRTEYFDIKCLATKQFEYFYWFLGNGWPRNTAAASGAWILKTDTLYLKLIINLKRNDATPNTQNVLLVLTYPMKTVNNSAKAQPPVSPICDSSVIPPASPSLINSFCQSAIYFNADRQRKMIKDSIINKLPVIESKITLSANPNKGMFIAKIGAQSAILKSINITDMRGRKLYSSPEGNKNLINGYSKQINCPLLPGIYILIAETSKGIQKTKFIVKD